MTIDLCAILFDYFCSVTLSVTFLSPAELGLYLENGQLIMLEPPRCY
jgi:hypothetical protein